MKSAVIGLGETGRPLFEILSDYHEVDGIDLKDCKKLLPITYEVINICIPYSNDFVRIVEGYQELCDPELTIIHSTVPIGTTSKIKNAVHSPILGRHKYMKEDIKKFTKWIGGERAEEAWSYFSQAHIRCQIVDTSEETEALKLMCLAKYGMSIAFAQYQQDICNKYGFDYKHVLLWDALYDQNVDECFRRPILSAPNGKIGGHCVIQNTKLLNEQHPNPILEEILKYE